MLYMKTLEKSHLNFHIFLFHYGYYYIISCLTPPYERWFASSCHNGIVCSVGPILRVALLIHVHDLCVHKEKS